jgi:hypothetical protein
VKTFRIAIGEGPPPRGPQLDKLRGNADHTEVVPPRLRHPALGRDEIRLVLSNSIFNPYIIHETSL